METEKSKNKEPVTYGPQFEEIFRLASLTEREKEIVLGHLNLGGNVEENREIMGAVLHMSPERVRQVEVRALKKMSGAEVPTEAFEEAGFPGIARLIQQRS